MLHKMKLQSSPFGKIQKRLKTIELRLYDEKWQKVKVGDQIEFINLEDRTQKILTRVVALHRFDSFEEMFRVLPAEAMGYSKGQTLKPEDMERYYSKEEQTPYGVIGIELALVDSDEVRLEKTGRYLAFFSAIVPMLQGFGWMSMDGQMFRSCFEESI